MKWYTYTDIHIYEALTRYRTQDTGHDTDKKMNQLYVITYIGVRTPSGHRTFLSFEVSVLRRHICIHTLTDGHAFIHTYIHLYQYQYTYTHMRNPNNTKF
jgi:hypothetical protein